MNNIAATLPISWKRTIEAIMAWQSEIVGDDSVELSRIK
jgi:hypothetical protein